MLPATGPAIEAARQAADEGADALVVGSPYYFGVEPAAQERHVEAVLAATPLPALLYNIPQCTHHVLPAETVGRLAREPRVLGIKDSAGDFEAFQKLLAIKRERAHFRVLQGHEALAAASLLQGGDGMVPAWQSCARALRRLQAAADRGVAGSARGSSSRSPRSPDLPAGRGCPRQGGVPMLGLGNGRPAPPLAPAAPAAREAIAVLLDEAGLGVAAGAARSREASGRHLRHGRRARGLGAVRLRGHAEGVAGTGSVLGRRRTRISSAAPARVVPHPEGPPRAARHSRDAGRFYIEGMLEQIGAGPIPMPGVPEVLERVRAGGYRLALASSAEVRLIQANLTALALGPLFEAVVSGTQVARGKPAPDVFLAVADRLAMAPDRCLVVEDSRNGLLAAKAAGMRCAVVPCAYTRHQDFREADHAYTPFRALPSSNSPVSRCQGDRGAAGGAGGGAGGRG